MSCAKVSELSMLFVQCTIEYLTEISKATKQIISTFTVAINTTTNNCVILTVLVETL